MILTTIVAATIYGWIEGWAMRVGEQGSEQFLATQNLWLLGHFSTYSVALGILFACITGGFSLIKGRSMFKHGKRYFLITFAGNYPFAWLVEDFAFFWFYPDWRLNDKAWTTWFLGGFWVLDPWRSGVKIWIPNWYIIVFVFWISMMLLAHRCTVYDNLVKDEIAREILPDTIKIPQAEVKKPEPETVAPRDTALLRPKPETEAPALVPSDEHTRHTETPVTEPGAKPKARSPEAEAALKKLRERWIIEPT
jgi:hypothetical protein